MVGIEAVFTKAIAFILIIIMGYGLKRKGFFHANDFYLISKIVIRITLPAAIVSNFSRITMERSLLLMAGVGFVANIIMIAAGYLVNIHNSKEEKTFAMLNVSGYNIGNFTLPFVQSFLGPVGFAVTSLFDAGNAIMCTGISYTLAAMVKGTGEKISVRNILKSLFSSIPFDAYIIMTTLTIAQIPLPKVTVSFAETVGNANAFLALLMLGIGFEIRMDRNKLTKIVKLIVLRYGFALIFALTAYFLLPFPLEIKKTLAIISFGPVSSVSPAFTGRLDGDVELASAINSISIVMSILTITAALIVVL